MSFRHRFVDVSVWAAWGGTALPIPNALRRRSVFAEVLAADGVSFGTDNGAPTYQIWVDAVAGNDTRTYGTQSSVAPVQTINRANQILTGLAAVSVAAPGAGTGRHAYIWIKEGQDHQISAGLQLTSGVSPTQRLMYRRWGSSSTAPRLISTGTTLASPPAMVRVINQNTGFTNHSHYVTWEGINIDASAITTDINGVDIKFVPSGIAAQGYDIQFKNFVLTGPDQDGMYIERAQNTSNNLAVLFDNVTSNGCGGHGFWMQSGYAIECTSYNNGSLVGAHGFSCYSRDNSVLPINSWTLVSGNRYSRNFGYEVWGLYTTTDSTWRRLRKATTPTTTPAAGQYSTVAGVTYIDVTGTGISPNATPWFVGDRKGNPRWLFCTSYNNQMKLPIDGGGGPTFAEEGEGFQFDDCTHGAMAIGCVAYGNEGHGFRFNVAEASVVYGLLIHNNHKQGMMIQSSIDCIVDGVTGVNNSVPGATATNGTSITVPTKVSDWNASTNTPAIPAASPANKDFYYIVTVAGSTNIDGVSSWSVGDFVVSNGTVWQKETFIEGDADILLVTDVNGCKIRNAYLNVTGEATNQRRACIEANGTCNLAGFSLDSAEMVGFHGSGPTLTLSGAVSDTLPGANQNLTGLVLDALRRPTNKVSGLFTSGIIKADPDGYEFTSTPNIGAYVAVVDRA